MALPPSSKPMTAETLAARNVQDLARVIVTEAGGENSIAQTAVGWALRNRMIRNGTPDGKPMENYAPSFASDPSFTLKAVAGVLVRTFKFYQQNGTGHVR